MKRLGDFVSWLVLLAMIAAACFAIQLVEWLEAWEVQTGPVVHPVPAAAPKVPDAPARRVLEEQQTPPTGFGSRRRFPVMRLNVRLVDD